MWLAGRVVYKNFETVTEWLETMSSVMHRRRLLWLGPEENDPFQRMFGKILQGVDGEVTWLDGAEL